MVRKKSLSSLKKKAWESFSRFIRLRGSVNGMNQCVTCGVSLPVKELQAGHFIDSRRNAVLFSVNGVFPQCVKCNIFLHGNKVVYTLFMQRQFGQDMVEDLIRESKRIVKYSRSDYEDMINVFDRAVADMGGWQ